MRWRRRRLRAQRRGGAARHFAERELRAEQRRLRIEEDLAWIDRALERLDDERRIY